MKNNGFRLLLAGLMLISPLLGQAQDRTSRGDFQKRILEQRKSLKKQLKLNKDQSVKFDEIYKVYDKKRQELMKNRASGDRQAMRDKMVKLRNDLNAKLKKVLTDKQYKKMQKIEQERRQQRGQGRGANRAVGGRGGRF